MAARKPGLEPGGTEFSHGKGLMSNTDRGYVPMEYEEHHSLYRMDSLDPGATPSYDGTGRDRDDRETTTPVREKGPAKYKGKTNGW